MPARDPIIFTSDAEADQWAAMHRDYLESNRRKLRACQGVYSVQLELIRRGRKPARLVGRGARNRALFQIELEQSAPVDRRLQSAQNTSNTARNPLD